MNTGFLNTNNPNNTNILLHTDLTDLLAYGLLLLWDSQICNEAQKWTSVSHAKHRQIREISEIRVQKIFVLFELFVFKKTRGQKISWSKNP